MSDETKQENTENARKEMQARYTQLCAELGHLIANEVQIKERSRLIMAEIQKLNTAAANLGKDDKASK